MTTDALITLAGLGLGALCIAFIALYALATLGDRKALAQSINLQASENDVIFLFEDETLVNATHAAHSVLARAADVGSDWSRLLSVILTRFPTIQSEISHLSDLGSLEIESKDGSTLLRAEWRNGYARLTLLDTDSMHNSQVNMDQHALIALEQELDTLRATTDLVPFLVWRELDDGTISWANAAYTAMADSTLEAGEIPIWPPKAIFDTQQLRTTNSGDFMRLNSILDPSGEKPYEVFPMSLDDGTLFTAMPAERTLAAERTLREFRQTLTKTFAHLTIGLAIFDKDRNLVLFNPALHDLTALPIEFLSMRPALTAFLDRLRDTKMMPEPKDYKSWRHEISALESAASIGTYEEIWSLHGGVTYRVTGRPHPDGAIAFLFENISAEMSLTRRFRSEIETSQAVFDSLNEAIAVFENDGTLLMANSAYKTLWGTDDTDNNKEVSVLDATRVWHAKCAPSPIWGDVRDFVGRIGERNEWESTTRLWDGRRVHCRFVPLANGQTLSGFTPEAIIERPPRRFTLQPDPSLAQM
ncbi:PAS domain-containing protein [Pacificibacter maritimus]|uniref:PAS domain-containing protein n=1 Tax=Pacificibacter maritimus TaxID=762213 RepID=A0A3N4U4M6_9RHOB|nr:PAS-domain containing protein [Pacificibacter maritimus]RPE64738.1 PAS domain-containing protein [Pacificibacter maritimus]